MLNNFKILNYILVLGLILISNSCSTSKNQDFTENFYDNDPFEETNRRIFEFNNDLDELLFKPVARGWRKIPEFPRENLSNLAETASAPLDIANSILQLDGESVRLTLSRFFINVMFGLGGMYDVASRPEFGSIEKRNEDFGQTLATWGFDDGPYIVLPIFGPSNVRDTIGKGIDTIFNPLTIAYRMNDIGFEARLPQPVVSGASTREKYLDYIEEIEENSLDFYATMKSLYNQKRIQDISNGKKKTQSINFEIPNFEFTDFEDNLNTEFSIDSTNGNSLDKTLPSSDYPDYNENNNTDKLMN